MRLVNGHSKVNMNPHWVERLDRCKCGSEVMVLFQNYKENTLTVQCQKCDRVGLGAPSVDQAIKNFRVLQLLT